MEVRHFYRLFDPSHPRVTRYVGFTKDHEKRLYMHRRSMNTSGLAAVWIKCMKSRGGIPGMEVLKTISFESKHIARIEGGKIEWDLISECAVDNQWLMNAGFWTRDKIKSGIPQNIVMAYLTLLSGIRCDHVDHRIIGALDNISDEYPRLKICNHYWHESLVADTSIGIQSRAILSSLPQGAAK